MLMIDCFGLLLISSNTSPNSDHVYNDLPIDLYKFSFANLIKRSYYPPDHGAFERLNFQIIFSLLKKSWKFSSLLILLNHFALALTLFGIGLFGAAP